MDPSRVRHVRRLHDGTGESVPGVRWNRQDVDGGYAEYMTAPVEFVHRIPEIFTDVEAAPLLCAGAIGYRSLRAGQPPGWPAAGTDGVRRVRASGPADGAGALSTLTRVSCSPARGASETSRERWAPSGPEAPSERAPEPLAAIIDTTPAWTPVVEALDNLAPGGRLVINAIRKENGDRDALLRLDYPRHLWLEKEIKSVANVTRADVRACLDLAGFGSHQARNRNVSFGVGERSPRGIEARRAPRRQGAPHRFVTDADARATGTIRRAPRDFPLIRLPVAAMSWLRKNAHQRTGPCGQPPPLTMLARAGGGNDPALAGMGGPDGCPEEYSRRN